MKRKKVFIVLILLIFFFLPVNLVSASPQENENTVIFHWILANWSDRAPICRVDIYHDGLPTGQDIISQCGQNVFDQFFATPPCDVATTGSTTNCKGLYLIQSETSMEWNYQSYLNPVSLKFEFPDCDVVIGGYYCNEIPTMNIGFSEENSDGLELTVDSNFEDDAINCEQAVCKIHLYATGESGILLEIVIYDPESQTEYSQIVRVKSIFLEEDEEVPRQEGWWVKFKSFHRIDQAEFTNIWSLEIPEDLPEWLVTKEELETDRNFYYLAGKMIIFGLVSPGTCPSKGLDLNGYATECGLTAVQNVIFEWQDQFDHVISFVSTQLDISPILLKNLIAKESQFWPENDPIDLEYGLGHMTLDGADTLFMWNYHFYDRYCNTENGFQTGCGFGYTELTDEQRSLLISNLINEVSIFCETCDRLIDYSHISFSIEVIGEVLLAYAIQTDQIIQNITGKSANSISSYEDLWKFTLANYNGGAGCLADSIQTAWDDNEILTWEAFALNVSEECKHIISYVEDISNSNNN